MAIVYHSFTVCYVQAIKSEAEGQKDAAGGASRGPTENGDKAAPAGDAGAPPQEQEGAAAMEQDEEEEDEDEAAAAMMPIRGPLPPEDGSWASCIRLLDPVEGVTVECLELGEADNVLLVLCHEKYASAWLICAPEDVRCAAWVLFCKLLLLWS